MCGDVFAGCCNIPENVVFTTGIISCKYAYYYFLLCSVIQSFCVCVYGVVLFGKECVKCACFGVCSFKCNKLVRWSPPWQFSIFNEKSSVYYTCQTHTHSHYTILYCVPACVWIYVSWCVVSSAAMEHMALCCCCSFRHLSHHTARVSLLLTHAHMHTQSLTHTHTHTL